MNSRRLRSDHLCDTKTFQFFWMAIEKPFWNRHIFLLEQCWMLYKEAITNTIIIVTVMPLFYLLLIHLPGNRYSMNLNHFHVSQNVIYSFWRAVNQIKKSVTSLAGDPRRLELPGQFWFWAWTLNFIFKFLRWLRSFRLSWIYELWEWNWHQTCCHKRPRLSIPRNRLNRNYSIAIMTH